jgi:hypothetical protein
MATRQPARKGPVYEMTGFPGARQPAGPSPIALAKLQENGHIVEEPAPGPPGPSPVPTPPSADVPVVSASAVAPPPQPPSDGPASDTTKPPPTRSASRRSTPRASARGASEREVKRNNKYTLPQPEATKGKSRSNHFRLPTDVEEFLDELATVHGCSRTRVVCSAIASEWQRLKRRQGRATKAAPT